MADDSVIGKRYPGYTFPIERGKIREFARRHDVAQPRVPRRPRGRRSPPTFLTAVGFWAPPASPTRVRRRSKIDLTPPAARRAGVRVPRAAAARRRTLIGADAWSTRSTRRRASAAARCASSSSSPSTATRAATLVAEARTTMIETGKPTTAKDDRDAPTLGRAAGRRRAPSRAVRPAHPHRLRALPGRVGRLQPDPPRRGVRQVGRATRRCSRSACCRPGSSPATPPTGSAPTTCAASRVQFREQVWPGDVLDVLGHGHPQVRGRRASARSTSTCSAPVRRRAARRSRARPRSSSREQAAMNAAQVL